MFVRSCSLGGEPSGKMSVPGASTSSSEAAPVTPPASVKDVPRIAPTDASVGRSAGPGVVACRIEERAEGDIAESAQGQFAVLHVHVGTGAGQFQGRARLDADVDAAGGDDRGRCARAAVAKG